MARVRQAYKFALDPTPAQERALRSHAGAARFAWNWGLAKCNGRYKAERKWYSAIDLYKRWNSEKKANPDLAWWPENSKCAYQEAFRNLDRALSDFIKSKKGERQDRRLGYPKFKERGKSKDSFRRYGVIRCDRDDVTLPRVGVIRTHEPTRALSLLVEDGTARILSATVTRIAQRWFVPFTVESDRMVPELALDRDVNAARNLLSLAGSGPERLKRLRSGGKTRPKRRARRAETGTRLRGNGSDRDRRQRGGCGMNTSEHSSITEAADGHAGSPAVRAFL